MIEIISNILLEAINLLNEISPYLLFGFFFAGLLHIFIKIETVTKHLGKENIGSVLKAALFGIPLPLCSCGVIPTALMLRNKGASKGAVLSFLISTPTSGVDSIAATYSLLGPLFAVYRVLASGFTGICTGMIENLVGSKEKQEKIKLTEECCIVCNTDKSHKHTLREKLREALSYGFVELVSNMGKWLLIGILIGGVISYFIPSKFIQNYLGSGWLAMVMMFVISIPIYVCACGAIPIVAALMAKGMSPGAGLIFLLAGPATNAASLVVLIRYLGLRSITIYLASIAICSIGLGWLLDIIWYHPDITRYVATHAHDKILPQSLQAGSSIVLLGLIGYSWVKPRLKKNEKIKLGKLQEIILDVPNINCQHCVNIIQNTLQKIKGVKLVEVSLKEKIVKIECSPSIPIEKLIEMIERAGYKAKKAKNN